MDRGVSSRSLKLMKIQAICRGHGPAESHRKVGDQALTLNWPHKALIRSKITYACDA
jgi:hypothetical protein